MSGCDGVNRLSLTRVNPTKSFGMNDSRLISAVKSSARETYGEEACGMFQPKAQRHFAFILTPQHFHVTITSHKRVKVSLEWFEGTVNFQLLIRAELILTVFGSATSLG